MNIRGLLGKQRELSKFLFDITGEQKIDIVILCETWLTKDSEQRVNVPGYTSYGRYRKHKKGGGVGFLISDELIFKAKKDYDIMCHHVESTFVELVFNGNNIIVGSLYRPPNTNAKDFITDFTEIKTKITAKHKHILLGLDHNLNLLNYQNHSDTQNFLEVIIDNDLFPCITRPTRLTYHSATLLDNILATEELYGVQHSGIIVSDLCDHLSCLSVFKNQKKKSVTNEKIMKQYMTDKNIRKIVEILEHTDLERIVHDNLNDVDQCANSLHSAVMDCIDSVAPPRETKVTTKKTYCELWMSKGLRKCAKNN